MGIFWAVLIVVAGFAVSLLIWVFFLYLSARLISIEDATFGRAVASAFFITVILAAVAGAFAFLTSTSDVLGVPYLIAVWLGFLFAPVAVVTLLKSGFQTTYRKAIALWFCSTGLGVLLAYYAYAAVLLTCGTVLQRMWAAYVS